MQRKNEIHRSSGNVFADMGAAGSEERLAKAELSRIILQTINKRGLKQAEAASLLGITQPDVSDLVRGRLRRFGLERLQRFLTLLGMDVEVRVISKPRKRKGRLKVALIRT